MLDGLAGAVTVFAGICAVISAVDSNLEGKGRLYGVCFRLAAFTVGAANLYAGLRVFL